MDRKELLNLLRGIIRKLENGISLIDKIPKSDSVASAAYRAGFARHEVTAAVEGMKDLLVDEIEKNGIKNG